MKALAIAIGIACILALAEYATLDCSDDDRAVKAEILKSVMRRIQTLSQERLAETRVYLQDGFDLTDKDNLIHLMKSEHMLNELMREAQDERMAASSSLYGCFSW